MNTLEGQLEELELRTKSYEQKLEGLQDVVKEYREGDVTYNGLMHATNYAARVEEHIMSEIKDLDLKDYSPEPESISDETMKQLEKLYGDRLEQLEDRIDYLEDKRRNMFRGTRK